MAEILNVSPFWFTAESDDMDKCSDTLILAFLDGRGYKNLATLAPKRGRKPASAIKEKAPRVKAAAAPVSEEENTITIPITLTNAPQMREAIGGLDADNAAMLLRALYVRAKAGGNAETLLDVVKLCLLS
jgi:hypothetical protein